MIKSRRNFIKITSMAGLGVGLTPSFAMKKAPKTLTSKEFTSAIQIAPFNFLDEGIEPVLDILKNQAAIDTMMVYSHTYYGIPYTRTANVLANDHGIVQRDDKDRHFNPVWVKHDKKNFKDTSLWFNEPDSAAEHAGHDIFNELVKPAKERGIKIYARLLEPGRLDVDGRIANYEKVTSVDIFGELRNEPCRNNPDYKAFMKAMVTDLFSNYELDGYQWGSERSGPLAEVLYRAGKPGCFCDHCLNRAKKQGINADKAKTGFDELYNTVLKTIHGNSVPASGVLNHIFHLFIKYPEILAWENLWHQSLNDLYAMIYTTIKSIKPEAKVGRHFASNMTTLNPIDRAATDYGAIAKHTDFIKPILYQDVMASRISDSFLGAWRKGTLKGMSEEGALELLRVFNGYSEDVLPPAEKLKESSLSAGYVYQETKRIVKMVEGKAEVFPGLGVNVPHREGKKFIRTPDSPERIYNSIIKSFEAGATGVVASREYDEMLLPSLKAFGDGVTEVKKRL